MNSGRRGFLKGSIALATLLALPRAILAAWPARAFSSTTASEALAELFGNEQPVPSSGITLGAPEIAENGAVVPITVDAELENVRSVSIVVEKNPRPLAISFDIPPGSMPNIACRIKMGQTSPVMAVVRTDSGLFSATKEVKVTIGGCGG